MALSYAQYSGDGANKNYAVPFKYLSRQHVGLSVDGIPVTFTWVNDAMLAADAAPANGTVVEVRRTTPRDQILVDYVDGSTLTEGDLDTGALQTFFLAQESFDAAGGTLSVNSDGSYSALNRRISAMADPVNAQDAVTKKWAETAQSAQLAQTIVAKNEAVSARLAAEGARDLVLPKVAEANAAASTATQKASDAATSATAAATSKTAIDGLKTSVEATKGQVDAAALAVSQDKAAVASDKATVAADRATTQGHRDKAKDYATKAEDSEVEPGFFSAFHWAQKAKAFAAGFASNIGFTPKGTIAATNVQAAIEELEAEKVRNGECRLVYGSATQVRLEPRNGNRIYVAGGERVIPPTGLVMNNSGLTAWGLYYVYATWTGSALALVASTTGHARDASTGFEVRSDNASQLLVGMVRLDGNAQFIETTNHLWVASWYNRRRRTVIREASISTTSTTFVEAGQTLSALSWADETADFIVTAAASCSVAATTSVGLWINGGVYAYAAAGYSALANANVALSVARTFSIPEGYNTFDTRIITYAGTGYFNMNMNMTVNI